jgi:DNA-binding NtrC family response regulator/DNA-binding CsgD family transcriptional regulator
MTTKEVPEDWGLCRARFGATDDAHVRRAVEHVLRCFNLSKRESQAAVLLAQGLRTAEIAQQLSCRETTAHAQVARVCKKTGCGDAHDFLCKLLAIVCHMIDQASPARATVVDRLVPQPSGRNTLSIRESADTAPGRVQELKLRRGTIVLCDPVMEKLRNTILRVARFPAPVLILGETGVGKDVAASMLHELSPRSERPFLQINCAALPEPLMESELFGHERGAFSGADKCKPGLIEAASGGTVFLDEIGELSPVLQAKLLVAVEQRKIMRIGTLRPRAVDVRFVAASNRDLPSAVKAGRFRRDLLYRLGAITLTVPPLRERPSEIEPLARTFLDDICIRFGLDRMSLSDATVAVLEEYRWPGNVRELRNVIERAAILVEADVIEPYHLDLRPDFGIASRIDGAAAGLHPVDPDALDPALMVLGGAASERGRIEAALGQCGGNQRRAAEMLGIPLRTLVRRIARLDLPRPRGNGTRQSRQGPWGPDEA